MVRDAAASTAREIAFHALVDAETRHGVDLKDVLDARLRTGALSDEDRRLATELVYGVVRWRRRLDMIVNTLARKPGRISRRTRCLLRMGVYQLLLMDRIPPHAAVHETVSLAHRHHCEPGFVNAILRAVAQSGDPVRYAERARHPIAFLTRRYSYPDWLVERWVEQHGVDDAEAICVANNHPAPLCLRSNSLRTSREGLIALLRDASVDASPGAYSDVAIYAMRLPTLTEYAPFVQGLFTVQDESSQLLTELLDPQPGEVVLDLCASPGGKTTHIAERMRDSGRIIANDIEESALSRIAENAARLGVKSLELRAQDGRCTFQDLMGGADRVLVDSPCSGIGILRRHPDARWGKNDTHLATLRRLQLELLRNAARHVRDGGVLVYGVCTDTPEETESVLSAFLSENAEFQVEPASACVPSLPSDAVTESGAMLLSPHRHGTDGFYAARLRHDGSANA